MTPWSAEVKGGGTGSGGAEGPQGPPGAPGKDLAFDGLKMGEAYAATPARSGAGTAADRRPLGTLGPVPAELDCRFGSMTPAGPGVAHCIAEGLTSLDGIEATGRR